MYHAIIFLHDLFHLHSAPLECAETHKPYHTEHLAMTVSCSFISNNELLLATLTDIGSLPGVTVWISAYIL